VIAFRPLGLGPLCEIAAGRVPFPGLEVPEGALPPPFIVERAIAALEGGADPTWHSFFALVEGRRLAACAGFKGPPAQGFVEIGYNVGFACRGRGVATTAVRWLVALAFADERVDAVRAETAQDNVASRRVLEKCGFACTGPRPGVGEQGARTLDGWVLTRPR